MTTLTPSQYEALPEEQREYWEPVYAVSNDRICDYTPIMIPLAEATLIIIKAVKAERERSMAICTSVRDKYETQYRHRVGKSDVAFVDHERAEIARTLCNSISGRTGLNISEELEDIINRNIHLTEALTQLKNLNENDKK